MGDAIARLSQTLYREISKIRFLSFPEENQLEPFADFRSF